MKTICLSLLIVLMVSCAADDDCNDFVVDCWNALPCECCSENWGGGNPPELAYVIFQGIERTGCDPNWVMLPPPAFIHFSKPFSSQHHRAERPSSKRAA